MADWRPTEAELDAWIESVLEEGPLAPAPPGLHHKVKERVHLAALEQKERLRFRNALLSGLAACVGVVATTVLLLAWTNFYLFLDHGISGGLGFLDYYTNTFQMPWPVRLDGQFLAVCLALGTITMWVGFQPLFRQNFYHASDAGRRERAVHGRLARMR